MSKAQTTFTIDTQTYHAYPTLEQFLDEAGIANANRTKQILTLFDREGIRDVSQLFSYATYDLIGIGISKKYAIKIAKHLQILRRRSRVILTGKEVKQRDKSFHFLTTGNAEIDHMLTHASTQTGLRSKSLVEVYGAAGQGKTQLMMTLAVMCMRSDIGWGRSVLYIDSEGAFDINRFYQIAAFYDISISEVNDKLLVARAYNFDEVDEILNEIAVALRTRDLGMIILDSIIDPLKAQYPIDEELNNLQERQQHLKQVTDKLKSLAQMHNLLAVITNQVRSAIGEEGSEKTSHSIVPQGGNVLAHATDMRFYIRTPHEKQEVEWLDHRDRIEGVGIKIATLELVDCGFLPQGQADLLIGPFGTADPNRWKQLIKQVAQQDHLSITKTTASGQSTEHLKQLQDMLYG